MSILIPNKDLSSNLGFIWLDKSSKKIDLKNVGIVRLETLASVDASDVGKSRDRLVFGAAMRTFDIFRQSPTSPCREFKEHSVSEQ